MLPKANRLGKGRDVSRVYQKGSRQSGRFLLLRTLPSRDNKGRVAVVVPTSVSKKATERNRAKRVIRAILRSRRLPAADAVVSVRRLPAAATLHHDFLTDLSQWFPA